MNDLNAELVEFLPNGKIDKFYSLISSEFPLLSIKKKKNVWWWRLIGLINPRLTKSFSTTIGNTIYLADNVEYYSPAQKWILLAHEIMHVIQFRALGKILFFWDYLFPIQVGFLGFLGFINPLLFVFFLYFLPLNAGRRSQMELSGYAAGACLEFWINMKEFDYQIDSKSSLAGDLEYFCDHFTSSQYYWVNTDEEDLEESYLDIVEYAMYESREIESYLFPYFTQQHILHKMKEIIFKEV